MDIFGAIEVLLVVVAIFYVYYELCRLFYKLSQKTLEQAAKDKSKREE